MVPVKWIQRETETNADAWQAMRWDESGPQYDIKKTWKIARLILFGATAIVENLEKFSGQSLDWFRWFNQNCSLSHLSPRDPGDHFCCFQRKQTWAQWKLHPKRRTRGNTSHRELDDLKRHQVIGSPPRPDDEGL